MTYEFGSPVRVKRNQNQFEGFIGCVVGTNGDRLQVQFENMGTWLYPENQLEPVGIPNSPLWCHNEEPHAAHTERNQFGGTNQCTGIATPNDTRSVLEVFEDAGGSRNIMAALLTVADWGRKNG